MTKAETAEMLQNTDGIIFDLDGTLVDSMWIWPAIDDDFLAKYDLTGQEPDTFHEGMEGLSYTEVAQYFLDLFPSLPLTNEEIMDEWMEMAHDKYMTQVTLKKGVESFIHSMRQEGKKIGIATSNDLSLTMDTLKALNAVSLFDSIHSATEVPAGKPSPDIYLLVAEDLGIPASRCLVFEDVPQGILAGKNAGMKVCAVEDDFSAPSRERKRELADYYIMDYDELVKGDKE